ncbi:uncharacterized protein TEOVI_000674100 [Trypanosoma equiperdum]|uniref:T. brucei spp.-specific protein n=4 Tax=Trypanozoon TaxID=39700 RepID=C9ZW76_TRYB9|nr:T. brucei spp.-specific protein [Trypanosoma brucei gambiense DAL972]XP_847431.1 uncharacterized protein Tb927.8.6010 [Trypanosoma brucei brucei TREU927]AAX69334.1 hypothetical predicted multi-pass transmembrane protein [Trypanosoma brucei]RHW72786.1 hypothetical protein DPX39_040057700 [Trypanosoma brucei equiperdum]SCU64574.1 hypothetical protein, conserved [Trypanosoma equiperdum]AAZ13365.1 hypothetical predicted multi-pass transmembrane protein [Trypanosoma brucei brucei TREU927]CBH136|eukprot:XP_011775941.1 T. brucei spp.-specific protein [Trypanosoma brucei gambiense DAL972]
MALSEKACLRIRVTVYTIFLISYLVGAAVFVRKFSNFMAASGFVAASIFIGLAIAMHVMGTEGLQSRIQPRSLKRVVIMGVLVAADVALLTLSIYTLVVGIKRREKWTGESNFCSCTAMVCGLKWCSVCVYLLYRSGTPSNPPEFDSLRKGEEDGNGKEGPQTSML